MVIFSKCGLFPQPVRSPSALYRRDAAREGPIPVIQSSRANTIEIGSFAAASTRRSAGRAPFHRVRPAFGNAQLADLPPSAPLPIRAKLSTGSPWRPDGSSARTKFSDGQEVEMAYERLDEALRQLKTDREPSPCSHRAAGSDLWRRSSGHAQRAMPTAMVA
jgi:hypothetical protein